MGVRNSAQSRYHVSRRRSQVHRRKSQVMTLNTDCLINVAADGGVKRNPCRAVRQRVIRPLLTAQVSVELIDVAALENRLPVLRALKMLVNLVSMTIRRP